MVFIVIVLVVRCQSDDQAIAPVDETAAEQATDSPSPSPEDSESPSDQQTSLNGVSFTTTEGDDGFVRTDLPSTGTWQIAQLDVAPAQETSVVNSYTVQVEDGLPVDVNESAQQIADTLNDSRGWTGYNDNSFRLVSDPAQAEFTIYLASSGTVDELCAPLTTDGTVDCRNGDRVVVNIDRWLYATPSYSTMSLDDYRSYVVNHEVGHYIGLGHRQCGGDGQLAPVMQQQTLDLQNCQPNVWPQDSNYE